MRGDPIWRALVVSCVSLQGCAALATVEAGVMWPASDRAGRVGLAVEAHAGMGPGADEGGVGLGTSARVRVAGDLQQLAVGAHVFALVGAEAFAGFGRAGLHLLQVEQVDGGFGFGSGSPFVSVGVIARDLADLPFPLVISLTASADVRLTRQPTEGFWALTIGTGLSGASGSPL